MITEAGRDRAPTTLRTNVVWVFAGQAGYALSQWLVLVLLAQLGGPRLVGMFGVALALTTPIMVFSQLHLRQILVVDAAQRFPFGDYRMVRWLTSLAAVAVLVLMAVIGYDPQLAGVIVALALLRLAENLCDIEYGLAQRHERLDQVAQSMLLRSLLGLIALLGGLVLADSLTIGLLAQTGVSVLVWWLLDRRVTRQHWQPPRGFRPQQRWPHWRELAWLGLPLGGSMLLYSLNINIPRYVVEAQLGLEALGILTALMHFMLAGRTVMDAIGQAASPRLANLHLAGERDRVVRLLLQMVAGGAVLGGLGVGGAILIGKPLLQGLYGAPFAVHDTAFVGLMVVGLIAFASAPAGYGLLALQWFRVQPLIQGLAAIVNVVACMSLAHGFDLNGAIAGWGVMFAFRGVVETAVLIRALRPAVASIDTN